MPTRTGIDSDPDSDPDPDSAGQGGPWKRLRCGCLPPPNTPLRSLRSLRGSSPSGPGEPPAEGAVAFATCVEPVRKGQWQSEIGVGVAIGLGIERRRAGIWT
ncbi:MAG: hypothetical protein ACOX52_03875 [Verrucomicrobiota bacterium]